MAKKIVLVNQTANYLFADIITAFANRLPHYTIEVWYGSFDYDITTLPDNILPSQGPQYNRNSFTKRFISWGKFYFWLRNKIRGIDKDSTSFFFVSNPPLFVFLPGLHKMKFACLIYDLYPDVLSGISQHTFINTLVKRWVRRNKKILPAAEKIFTLGTGLKAAIGQYLPESSKGNVVVVPIWNKQAVTVNSSQRDFRTEWGLADKKVILYAGNIGITHPLEYLVELAKKMQNYPDWKIVVVGNDNKKVKLSELAKGMDNIAFYQPVPLHDLPQLLSIATWGYVTLDTSATNNSVPSKTYNLLAAGIPLLAMVNDSSEIATLIDTYNTGIYFKETGIETVIEKLLSVSEDEYARYKTNTMVCAQNFTPALAYQFVDNWILNV